jgi:hypothetical protein
MFFFFKYYFHSHFAQDLLAVLAVLAAFPVPRGSVASVNAPKVSCSQQRLGTQKWAQKNGDIW